MRFLVVSTFNRKGLDLYGRRMISTFEDNWPDAVDLAIYAEGWGHAVERGAVIDLETVSPWLSEFKRRHADKPTQNYRMDAVRFAHKVAAVCHAAKVPHPDVLIWVDGDVLTHSPVTMKDLEDLAPKGDEWIAWLDRATMYPETGFYMLNCNHQRHEEMIGRFEAMYADDGLFSLPEWHDSFVLEQVVKEAGVGMKSLSGEGRDTTHPMVNGLLGQWFDHAKGNRKKHGRSPKRDLVRPRPEQHWQ
ncbi:hypothetical protein [Methyloceanibacter caenitepidi]|uniref:Glycosyltransferase n=1 Tax=Methyloceanibacter caenitepidi TaxID=1384459 RepID=A0A0A8K8L0_9HYPH|nr:hypothetical protein [Methyloceanibacter caenitepidi]BAQ18324.1 hypothetical protein GL4_2891 [Methyloceanibacter caenitepidi]